MAGIERRVVEVVAEIAAPLVAASESPAAARGFARALGWDLDAASDIAAVVDALARVAEATRGAIDQLDTDPDDSLGLVVALAELGLALTAAAGAVAAWRPTGVTTADAERVAEELSLDLLAGLADMWLVRRVPKVRTALLALGILALEPTSDVSLGAAVVRPAGHRLGVRFEQLGRWVSAPDAALRDVVERTGGSTGTWAALAVAAWEIAGPEIAEGLVVGGLPSVWRPADAAAPVSLWLFTSNEWFGTGLGPPSAWAAFAVEGAAGGIALHVVPRASWTGTVTGQRWRASGTLGAIGAFSLSAAGVAADADVTVGVGLASLATPAVLVGPATGPHLEIGAVTLDVDATFGVGDPPTFEIALQLTGVAIGMGPGGTDSFVGRLLGGGKGVGVDVGATWSPEHGLQVKLGLQRLQIVLVEQLDIGPITVHRLILQLDSVDEAIAIDVYGDIAAKLGPLAVSIERIGIRAKLTAGAGAIGVGGVELGPLPPKGLGARIAAGPVTGGGYLFCDPEKGEYGGALELTVGPLSLKALGLLNTKLPGGQNGFSLIVIITCEFSPIQLGYGFMLAGVGGLLGVNRTMAVDPLRDGVRTRSLDAILFPKDPVANATRLLGVLRAVFPPAEGRFTFGPMVKLGWGPNLLLDIEVAVVLELPMPLRLAILGRVQVILPYKDAAVLKLRLDVLGILDFDRGEVSVDASIIDSMVAGFVISGDMAMRAGWKGSKGFALAVGGFHPKFERPPGFPQLQRLAISLATGDTPRLRLAAYMALTSNTFQFGAALEFYLGIDTSVGSFSASAHASMDALLQFSPFHLVATLSMGIDVAWNGNPLLHAVLEAQVEGPSPWHVSGYIEFSVLLIKARMSADLVAGQTLAVEPTFVDLRPVVRAAFDGDDAWSADLPPATRTGVSLRMPGTTEGLVVHPLGRFTVRQRSVPLDLEIGRFGAAVPTPGTPTRFEIDSMTVGGTYVPAAQLTAVVDDFAAAQFADLTDDEKLARPGFESMASGAGVSAATGGHRWPVATPAGASPPTGSAPATPQVEWAGAAIGYDEAVVDAAEDGGFAERPGSRQSVSLDATVAASLVAGGAAARSPQRIEGPDNITGPERKITVTGERYVAAPLDALPLGASAADNATSYAQAVARRGPVQQLVSAGEVVP